MHCGARSVVGHAVVREIVGPYPLGSVAAADELAALLRLLAVQLLATLVKNSRAEEFHRFCLVPVLRPFVLRPSWRAGRGGGGIRDGRAKHGSRACGVGITWIATTVPVGRCVILTALLVVFTCWPPAP